MAEEVFGTKWKIGDQVAVRTNRFISGVVIGEIVAADWAPGAKARGDRDDDRMFVVRVESDLTVVAPPHALHAPSEVVALREEFAAKGKTWLDID